MNRKSISSVVLGLVMSLSVIPQSGGGFEVQRSVIAGGGGDSAGGVFAVTGTLGQGVAGSTSNGGGFAVNGGFWGTLPMGTTAAAVTISGRVVTASGGGIRNVQLTLTSGDGSVHQARTNAFGFYSFDQVRAGRTYVLEIIARHFLFAENVRLLDVRDQLVGIDFVAQEN